VAAVHDDQRKKKNSLESRNGKKETDVKVGTRQQNQLDQKKNRHMGEEAK